MGNECVAYSRLDLARLVGDRMAAIECPPANLISLGCGSQSVGSKRVRADFPSEEESASGEFWSSKADQGEEECRNIAFLPPRSAMIGSCDSTFPAAICLLSFLDETLISYCMH